MSCLWLCLAGAGQLQDLHSKLVLDHPRGEADQLHKCISSASTARGVFDGNVKVRSKGTPPTCCGGRSVLYVGSSVLWACPVRLAWDAKGRQLRSHQVLGLS